LKTRRPGAIKTCWQFHPVPATQIMISDLTDDNAKNKPLANAAVVKIVYKDGKYTVPEIGTMKYVEAGKGSR
jgi:hypothetical protein